MASSKFNSKNQLEFKQFLDAKVEEYNRPTFIDSDPICIPKQFEDKRDVEIVGLLVATIAWGQRKSIINNGERLVKILQHQPYQFLTESSEKELENLSGFVHRTFNSSDLSFFLKALKSIYERYSSLEEAILTNVKQVSAKNIILSLRELLLTMPHQERVKKHISNPENGSAAKRLNMYLRWMVRSDSRGVDFGIWDKIAPSILYCPLDVHSGRVARKLGLLNRTQNDWKATEELSMNLRKLDPKDPVKYDFALFGLGVFEKF
ncbi:MAG: TIGR02757 family protein [Flavobacteriales bacterium]|nr:TIGR02757 family protein [Flavobacteriales bacterium]